MNTTNSRQEYYDIFSDINKCEITTFSFGFDIKNGDVHLMVHSRILNKNAIENALEDDRNVIDWR